MGENGKQVMTAAEVAELLRVHLNTVYNRVAAGTLPHFRVGRAIRFRRSEIEALDREQIAA